MNASASLLPVSPRLPLACGVVHPWLGRAKHLSSQSCDAVTSDEPSTGRPNAAPEGRFVLGEQVASQRFRHRKRMDARVRENIDRLYRQVCLVIARTATSHLIPFSHGRIHRQFQA